MTSRKLAALVDLLDGADCLYDPELHDGPAGIETDHERAAREDVAKQVCAACPMLAACRRYTAQARPESGVWAGRTPAERNTTPLGAWSDPPVRFRHAA